MNRGISKIEVIISLALAFVVIIVDIFVIVHLNNKSRDIQVMSEVSRIRSGLENFLLENNYYPVKETAVVLNDSDASTEKLCSDGFKRINEKCLRIILEPIPNLYGSLGNVWRYRSPVNSLNYQLEFELKTNFNKQGLLKGLQCATNSAITNGPCF